MHVFTHTFDYIALSILIACMLSAGAMALYKARYSNARQRRILNRERCYCLLVLRAGMMASRLNHRERVIPAQTDHLEDKGGVIGPTSSARRLNAVN
jgi:hypothetical protein